MNDTNQVTLTREELYSQVWQTPMRTLAKKYDLSDVGLAKICKKHQIPRPGVGHWAKLQFGKPVEQEPLSAIDDERLAMITINPQMSKSTKFEDASEAVDPEIATMIANERLPEKKIVVSPNLPIRHPLVKATKEAYSGRKVGEYGRIYSRHDFNQPHFEVSVSKENFKRALRVLQALVTAMENRGFQFTTERKTESSSRDPHEPRLLVLDEIFRLSIWEPSKKKKITKENEEKQERDRYSYWGRRQDYEPTGIIELHLNRGSYMSNIFVRDTMKIMLEDRLNEFICKMLKLIDERKVKAEQRKIEEAVKAEGKRIAIEQEINRRSDRVRAEALFDRAELWEKVRKLEVYVEAVRANVMSRNGRILADSESGRWLEWADTYLSAIDPLGVDKELPTYSLTEQQNEQLRRECHQDWNNYTESFRER
jgi:hypothetical protein